MWNRIGTVFLALSLTLASCVAANVPVFRRSFAPQDGIVAPSEQPSRSEICLNGKWQFQPVGDALPSPLEGKWERTPIRIPSPWNVNAFPDDRGLGGDFRCFPSYPPAWDSVRAGWLRRTFSPPTSWRGKRILLHFNAVAGDARILVNGKQVSRHFDNFLPFEADVTDFVILGAANELLVGVRKASLEDKQGPYGRRTYQGGSMWGQAIAGIWQDVFLTAVPCLRVDNVFVKANIARGNLVAEVTVRNDTDRVRTVRLNGNVREWLSWAGKSILDAPEPKWSLAAKIVVSTDSILVTVKPHSFSVASLTANHVGDRLKRWSPRAPNLYGLTCTISGTDSKYTRFGWREVSLQGSKVLLNGEPLIMKGDSWHFMGIPQMTRRYAWAWFKAVQNANLNAVRLHAEPYPSFYLDMADEMGILVLDETAVWASDGGPKLDDAGFWKDSERHLSELILRDRNHPAVFGWSVSNEVSAVVRNVFHAPQRVEDKAQSMNGVWAEICRRIDPTRSWISADGEEDGKGVLPAYVIHYGDRSTMDRAIASGKPWGVGEAGPAYYGTPQQIAKESGIEESYLSVADRMAGVAKISYLSLMDQREKGASYRSVFNLVWYGLQPLELGLRDTSRPPQISDGVFFKAYTEGQTGVQPERLGPYCTTLNPGYDPSLPLYRTWPLFDAIKDAQAEPPVPFPGSPASGRAVVVPSSPRFSSVRVLAGMGSDLGNRLAELGVLVSLDAKILFVDGTRPTPNAKMEIGRALDAGQTVFVWGASRDTLSALNLSLPFALELTNRTSTSLVAAEDGVTRGIAPSDLYFTELSPSVVLSSGLGGPLIQHAKTLLRACDADWRLWNGQPETTKTSMILRSERETKPSGVALAEVNVGKGRLFVCSLPVAPETSKGEKLDRSILQNLGIELAEGRRGQRVIGSSGEVLSALSLGPFSAASREDAIGRTIVWPDWEIARGRVVEGHVWNELAANSGGALSVPGDGLNAVNYVSFWLYSPIALDNLLLDPHLPSAHLDVTGPVVTQLWLGTKVLNSDGGLPLQKGWNRVLIKSIGSNSAGIQIRISSSQIEFLAQIRGALEMP